jgi:DNA-binding beta-propeller fold protein YncE
MHHRLGRVFLTAVSLFTLVEVGAAEPVALRHVHQGIAVDLSIESLAEGAQDGQLLEGQPARFRFRVTDTTSGLPLSGVYPAAWMDLFVKGIEADALDCDRKVEELVGGSLFAQAELDLNVFYVVALNDDATLTVVDPLFGFGGTKLLAMVLLESPGEDWVLTPEGDRIYVSLPQVGKVAVVDTARWKVASTLDAGVGARRVALQPDEAYLWVSYGESQEGPSGFAVFNARTLELVSRVETGRGRHEITFRPDSRYAFVTNSREGTVAVVDVHRLEVVQRLETGVGPAAIDYSSQARAAYVSHAGVPGTSGNAAEEDDGTDGGLVAIDGESHQILARIPAPAGIGELRFAPGGRFALAPHTAGNTVLILDAARNRVIQTADVEDGPYRIAFSDELAYIQHLGSEIILMIPLDTLGSEGTPVSIIDFPGGQSALGKGPRLSPAASLIQAPGANAILLANGADQAIYYYREGMAAPMGSFQNYGRQPRAVLVVDRSLKERAPGNYETVAQLRRPGHYALAFFLDAPRIIHCFDVEVVEDPAKVAERRARNPVAVEYLATTAGPHHSIAAGQTATVRFRLTDATTGEPLTALGDVQVLAYRPPGTRQNRLNARALGEGVYEAELPPQRPGRFTVRVACPSQGLHFQASPPLWVDALSESQEAP